MANSHATWRSPIHYLDLSCSQPCRLIGFVESSFHPRPWGPSVGLQYQYPVSDTVSSIFITLYLITVSQIISTTCQAVKISRYLCRVCPWCISALTVFTGQQVPVWATAGLTETSHPSSLWSPSCQGVSVSPVSATTEELVLELWKQLSESGSRAVRCEVWGVWCGVVRWCDSVSVWQLGSWQLGSQPCGD